MPPFIYKKMKTIIITIIIAVFFIINKKTESQWQNKPSGVSATLNCITQTGSNALITAGMSGVILKSSNNGDTWQQVSSPVNVNFESISSFQNNIVLTGDRTILKSTNNGDIWFQIMPNAAERYFYIKYADQNNIISFGYDGVFGTIIRITKSSNGGATWYSSQHQPVKVYFTVCAIDADTYYAAGEAGFIQKTTDGGLSWVTQNSQTAADIHKIHFINNNTGFASGDYNASGENFILKTTNGGINWNTYLINPQHPTYQEIRGCYFNGNTYGFTGGTSGYMYKTSNGGINWIAENTGYYNDVKDIIMTNVNTAITVGGYGRILKYSGTVGISNTGGNIPSGFNLSQNYPNPFNPSTKISFSLPKASQVKLVVYDAAGREVETLVDEQLNAGAFEVDFNASKLTSGVYFYKMVTDGFTDVKKMILVK